MGTVAAYRRGRPLPAIRTMGEHCITRVVLHGRVDALRRHADRALDPARVIRQQAGYLASMHAQRAAAIIEARADPLNPPGVLT